MSAPVLLSVKSACVAYGGVPALEGVSLSVEEGQIVTVIGPNGAGKTTLLNGLMGLVPLTGEVKFLGIDLSRLSVEQRVAMGLALVTEQRDLFGAMTVEDNLALGAFHRRSDGRKRLQRDVGEVFELFPRLQERRAQTAQTLSGGERQMLALGRALLSRPRLLMLDEPSLGLAPLVVRSMFEAIRSLRGRGVAVLLVEQNARAALRSADHGYVLETGSIVLEGPAGTLAQDARVADSYLGSVEI